MVLLLLLLLCIAAASRAREKHDSNENVFKLNPELLFCESIFCLFLHDCYGQVYWLD